MVLVMDCWLVQQLSVRCWVHECRQQSLVVSLETYLAESLVGCWAGCWAGCLVLHLVLHSVQQMVQLMVLVMDCWLVQQL